MKSINVGLFQEEIQEKNDTQNQQHQPLLKFSSVRLLHPAQAARLHQLLALPDFWTFHA